jgi:hypothetical protein
MIVEDESKVDKLRIQSLELTCAAMWTILKDKLAVTDEELVHAIHAIDARDGVADGKIAQAARVCPHCHRKVLTRNPTTCAWCGGDLALLGSGPIPPL